MASFAVLLVAAGLVVAGPVGLLLGLSSPLVRSMPLAFVALSLAGGVLALAHARARRAIVSIVAALGLAAVAGAFAYGAIVVTRVPRSEAVPRVGDAAPSFSVPRPGGDPVTLEGLVADGPRVLVFFRGTW